MEEVLKFSSTSLRPTLMKCLMEEGGKCGLTKEVCKQLLLEDGKPLEVRPDTLDAEELLMGELLMGYPDGPLYIRLADSMSYWLITGKCPVFDLPTPFLLPVATTERKEKLEAVGSLLVGVYATWESLSEQDRAIKLLEVFKLLSLRGVLDLLGLRCTASSCAVLPPPRTTLLGAFTRQHCPQAKLSVGARALSKHCHRDSSQQWWGTSTGSEAAKNEHALGIAEKILDSAVWINIHIIPHDVRVLEVRLEEGYGMRWSGDGSEFRGFLEPQMEDGHSAGWRH